MNEVNDLQPERRPEPRPHEPLVQELMRIHSGTVDGVPFLNIAGEIDSSNARDLVDAAARTLDSGAKDLIIDMRDVTYMDASGYHALIDIREIVTDQKGTLVLTGIREPIERVTTILSLDRLMTVVDTIDQALARIKHYPFKP